MFLYNNFKKKFVKKMEELLTCQICQDLFHHVKESKKIPCCFPKCGHSLCFECCQNLENTLKCPFCRQTSLLPNIVNHALLKIVEFYRGQLEEEKKLQTLAATRNIKSTPNLVIPPPPSLSSSSSLSPQSNNLASYLQQVLCFSPPSSHRSYSSFRPRPFTRRQDRILNNDTNININNNNQNKQSRVQNNHNNNNTISSVEVESKIMFEEGLFAKFKQEALYKPLRETWIEYWIRLYGDMRLVHAPLMEQYSHKSHQYHHDVLHFKKHCPTCLKHFGLIPKSGDHVLCSYTSTRGYIYKVYIVDETCRLIKQSINVNNDDNVAKRLMIHQDKELKFTTFEGIFKCSDQVNGQCEFAFNGIHKSIETHMKQNWNSLWDQFMTVISQPTWKCFVLFTNYRNEFDQLKTFEILCVMGHFRIYWNVADFSFGLERFFFTKYNELRPFETNIYLPIECLMKFKSFQDSAENDSKTLFNNYDAFLISQIPQHAIEIEWDTGKIINMHSQVQIRKQPHGRMRMFLKI